MQHSKVERAISAPRVARLLATPSSALPFPSTCNHYPLIASHGYHSNLLQPTLGADTSVAILVLFPGSEKIAGPRLCAACKRVSAWPS